MPWSVGPRPRPVGVQTPYVRKVNRKRRQQWVGTKSGATWNGTGAISGTGTVSGTGVPTHLGSGAVSGTGTVSGTGLRVAVGSGAISGTGTVSASGQNPSGAVVGGFPQIRIPSGVNRRKDRFSYRLLVIHQTRITVPIRARFHTVRHHEVRWRGFPARRLSSRTRHTPRVSLCTRQHSSVRTSQHGREISMAERRLMDETVISQALSLLR